MRNGQHRPAGLGLPVVVDDGLVQCLADPACGGLVQRLAGKEEAAQARQIMSLQQRRILLFEYANGGRCGEHHVHPILLDDAPPDRTVGTDWRAFVHDRRQAREQRRVDDVAVAHDPAHVRCSEHRVAGLRTENERHRRRERHRIAAGITLHAFWFAGGTGGVEDVRGLARFHPFARHLGVRVLGGERCVVDIARVALHGRELAIDEQHALGLVRRKVNRGIEQWLVLDHLARARACIRTDDHARRGVIDARGETVGGKAAEHDRMDRADACTGQHGERGFRNHRQVNQHAVAPSDAQRLQARRHAVDLAMELAIRVRDLQAGFGGDVHQRRLLTAGGEMPVDGVVAEVGASAHEPLCEWQARIVQDGRIRRLPFDALGLFAPEASGVINGALIQRAVRGGHGHDVVSWPSYAMAQSWLCLMHLLCDRQLTRVLPPPQNKTAPRRTPFLLPVSAPLALDRTG